MNMVFPVADPVTPLAAAPAILAAANLLLPHLERGQRVDAATLRGAMETAFGGSDATGVWDWKMAYEACEVATVLFLRKYAKPPFRAEQESSSCAVQPLWGAPAFVSGRSIAIEAAMVRARKRKAET